jgi:hypothetical protein
MVGGPNAECARSEDAQETNGNNPQISQMNADGGTFPRRVAAITAFNIAQFAYMVKKMHGLRKETARCWTTAS